jgi:hypothetical protein
MIEHRGCNKQVRDRVSAEPSLIERSYSVRGAIHLACFMTLPVRESSKFVHSQISH